MVSTFRMTSPAVVSYCLCRIKAVSLWPAACASSVTSGLQMCFAGVKFGDSQATMQGLIVAGAFLFISRSSPLEALSEERPHSTIFTPSIMLSMAAQFVVHMASLMTICSAAKKFERTKEELCVFSTHYPRLAVLNRALAEHALLMCTLCPAEILRRTSKQMCSIAACKFRRRVALFQSCKSTSATWTRVRLP